MLVGFRYWTDGAAIGAGFMVDDIAITGQPVDGAEAAAGWTFAPATGGFRATTGVETASYFNTYIAEFRQYRETFDSSLQTGPYNFGFGNNPTLRNYAERYPYQDGLLVSYWDTSQGDNDAIGASRRRADPADRLAPRAAPPAGQRPAVECAAPVLRLDRSGSTRPT